MRVTGSPPITDFRNDPAPDQNGGIAVVLGADRLRSCAFGTRRTEDGAQYERTEARLVRQVARGRYTPRTGRSLCGGKDREGYEESETGVVICWEPSSI